MATAAPIPSSPSATPAGQPQSQNANQAASEIAWKFVLQYYKYMNKEPQKLHCFYTKRSTLIHGTEGEETKSFYGQHEIHSRIMSLNLDECKVFVHNVDSQSSAEGGIVIQVIGELQSASEATHDVWHKFTQTFFLAEQPNGYFVLNDIFRYIREESSNNDMDNEVAEQDGASVAPPPSEPAPAAPAAAAATQQTGVEASTEEQWQTVGDKQVNGVHLAEEESTTAEPTTVAASTVEETADTPVEPEAEVEPAVETLEVEQPTPAPAPVEEETPAPAPEAEPAAPSQAPSAPAPSAPVSSAAAPSSSAPAAAAAAAKPAALAEPSRPPGKLNWAALAGSGATKWGTQMASSTGISSAAPAAAPAASSSAAPSSAQANGTSHAPSAQSTSQRVPPAQQPQQQQGSSGPYDTSSITSGSTFVKGVVETISDEALKTALEQFGPTTEVSIVRTKACAFVEFASVAAAKKAVAASHDKGGIVVSGATDSPRRKVYVEEKKEKGQAGRGGRTDPTGRGAEGYGKTGHQQRTGDGQQRQRGGGPAGRGRGTGQPRTASAAVAK